MHRTNTEPEGNAANFLFEHKDRAYRRGFQHGALQALIALQGGATIDDLRRWAERVDDWRWRRVYDTLPPSPIGGER